MKTSLARTNAILPLAAASGLTDKVGCFVVRTGDTVALATNPAVKPFGVLLTDGTPGEQVTVAVASGGLAGTVRVKLAAAVTVSGAFLQLAANGRVVPENPADTSRCVCALALETGAINELIEAVLFNPIAYSAMSELAAAISGSMGVVVHGSNAATARPTGHDAFTWIGSVEPSNALVNDIWENTGA